MTSSGLQRSNLSQQISSILREEILTKSSPGQRLPTIMELTKRFNVSFQTVREGLNILAEEGLIQRRPGAGTFVSAVIPAQRDRHVGVLAEIDISDPHASYFFRRTPQRVVRFLRREGFAARLYTGHTQVGDETIRPLTCTAFLEAVERQQLSGVVAFAPSHTLPQWLEPLPGGHVPVVGSTDGYDYRVELDHPALVRTGVQYLLNQGRRRIALLEYFRPSRQASAVESFLEVMAAAGAPVNPQWLRHSLNPCTPGANWEEFRAVWASGGSKGRQGDEKPDGLLICDDNLFPVTAMAILQLGIRVPEDLTVVTHSNKGSAMLSPFPVAKLEIDPDVCAGLMGRTLIRLMQKEPVAPGLVILPHRLVEADAAAPQESRAGEQESRRARRDGDTATEPRPSGDSDVGRAEGEEQAAVSVAGTVPVP